MHFLSPAVTYSSVILMYKADCRYIYIYPCLRNSSRVRAASSHQALFPILLYLSDQLIFREQRPTGNQPPSGWVQVIRAWLLSLNLPGSTECYRLAQEAAWKMAGWTPAVPLS